MKMRYLLKQGIILIIESDGNPITVVIRVSKKTIIRVLDMILPDDEPVQAKS